MTLWKVGTLWVSLMPVLMAVITFILPPSHLMPHCLALHQTQNGLHCVRLMRKLTKRRPLTNLQWIDHPPSWNPREMHYNKWQQYQQPRSIRLSPCKRSKSIAYQFTKKEMQMKIRHEKSKLENFKNVPQTALLLSHRKLCCTIWKLIARTTQMKMIVLSSRMLAPVERRITFESAKNPDTKQQCSETNKKIEDCS